MLHASTQKLITKLCDLTERGEAPWREGEDGACWFETEGYRIEVKPEPASVRVLQAGGREVESADVAQLGSAAFPGEPGKTFADRVKRMGLEAQRIARGTDTHINTILSALSSPPAAEAAHFSTEGGPESEAAMAAAVADMALRLKQQPLEEPAPVASVAPPAVPASPAMTLAAAAPPQRTVRTHAMFGAIPSFATATPGVKVAEAAKPATPSPAPPAAAQKVTSSGLVVTGFHAVSVQTPGAAPMPELKRPSSAGYRPWT